MYKLTEIRHPVAGEIKEFEKLFRKQMKSNVPLLNLITAYLMRTKGKQMRPLFVFLIAGMHDNINQATYTGAALIELLHTATLVHDDVVDDSQIRRGMFSVNALWKNKVAVLIGDYLLSRGLLLSLDTSEYELLKIVSEATKEMSEGELLQIEKARRLDVDEKLYFEIIRKKTASLIASCCAVGAASAKASPLEVEKARLFGEKLGIAFQIKDDIFDYQKNLKTGKPNGIDIREKKMTLPLLYALGKMNSLQGFKTKFTIRFNGNNKEKVGKIIRIVEEYGGIEYSEEMMNNYIKDALGILFTYPENDYRDSLEKLVRYTVERKR